MLNLLAQVAAVPAIQGWLQLATSTGFVGLAWYLIVLALPAIQRRFDEHSDRQMTAFSQEIKRISENHSEQVATIIELATRKTNG